MKPTEQSRNTVLVTHACSNVEFSFLKMGGKEMTKNSFVT